MAGPEGRTRDNSVRIEESAVCVTGDTGMRHTVILTLSDSEIYYLRKLYKKRSTTKPATLVTIAIKRAVDESAMAELAKPATRR